MTFLDRLRGARRGPQRVAVVDDAQDLDVEHDDVDAIVEMRPPRLQPRTRFGQLEKAATATALWVLRLLAIAAGLVALLWVVGQMWAIVLPLLLALILTTVLYPGAALLRRVMPNALAALLVLLAFLGAIVGVFAVLIPRVVDQAGELRDQVVEGYERLQATLVATTEDGAFGIEGAQISEWVDTGLSRLQENAESIGQSLLGSVGTGLVTGLTSVGSGLITLLLVLVLAFFFMKDGHKFLPWLHLWTGRTAAGHADELLGRTWKTLGGYIWSQAAVALVDAVFIGLGLWALGVPFALPLAVLIFFAAFIPIVGAVSTGALAVLVALFANGLTNALLVLLLVLAVQQIESNLLQPFLVGKALALHPAVVIGSVTVGGTLFGIIGAFLAVPVAAVGTVALRYVREAVRGEEPHKGEGGGKPPLDDETSEEVDERADEGRDTRPPVDAHV